MESYREDNQIKLPAYHAVSPLSIAVRSVELSLELAGPARNKPSSVPSPLMVGHIGCRRIQESQPGGSALTKTCHQYGQDKHNDKGRHCSTSIGFSLVMDDTLRTFLDRSPRHLLLCVAHFIIHHEGYWEWQFVIRPGDRNGLPAHKDRILKLRQDNRSATFHAGTLHCLP